MTQTQQEVRYFEFTALFLGYYKFWVLSRPYKSGVFIERHSEFWSFAMNEEAADSLSMIESTLNFTHFIKTLPWRH